MLPRWVNPREIAKCEGLCGRVLIAELLKGMEMQERSQMTQPSDHALILALARQGVDAVTIAAQTGANIHTVRVLLRRCGATTPRERPQEGLREEE